MEAEKTTDEIAARFNHYDADEVNTILGDVNGWVPAQNVEPLTDEIKDAEAQYYSDDGAEAFVTTL